MKKLQYGIIGCGMMGREHIQNIKLLENSSIIGIVEPNEDMRKAALELVPTVGFYNSIAELLALEELDCLVIVSPNYMHVEQLKEIAAIRPLPILVEKPLATNPDQIEVVKDLIKTYPAPIWVAMEYRYMPPVAKLIDQAAEATGGIDMLSIREHRFPFLEKVNDWNRFNENSGGTFVEKCCHFFDLMRLILKSEPVSVMASCGQAHNHLDEIYEGQVPDILDHGYVIVNFESGARAMLELCMFAEGARYQEEISVVGPKGKIECLVPGPSRFWPKNLGDAPVPQLILSPRNPKGPEVLEIAVDPQLLEAGDHNGSTFYQHKKFQQVVLGDQQPEVSLNDGLMAVRMGLAAQKSAATGETVKINQV